MAKFDQAEGLRRLLSTPKTKLVSVLSTLDCSAKNLLILNLTAAIAQVGKEVLIVDMNHVSQGSSDLFELDRCYNLLEVAQQKRTMPNAIKCVSIGLDVTMLRNIEPSDRNVDSSLMHQVTQVFEDATNCYDLVVADIETDMRGQLPLSKLEDGDILIQMGTSPVQIKSAYSLIKRLSQHTGRRDFGIVISGANENDAKLIFSNMAHACSRYLALSLKLLGNVPDDASIHKAAAQGRSVVDAYPSSNASRAYNFLASFFAQASRSDVVKVAKPITQLSYSF